VNRDSRFSHFTELSMGMTGDLEVAIEEGATMIRVAPLCLAQDSIKLKTRLTTFHVREMGCVKK
jgi:hypothetical protein